MRFFVALLLVTFASAASAQERDHAPLLLELPANTRALGMGTVDVLGGARHELVDGEAFGVGDGLELGAGAWAGRLGGRRGPGPNARDFVLGPEGELDGRTLPLAIGSANRVSQN